MGQSSFFSVGSGSRVSFSGENHGLASSVVLAFHLDFSSAEGISPLFVGGLLLYEKWLYERNSGFRIVGIRPEVRRELVLNGMERLLAG